VGERRPSWRSRALAWIAHRLGADAVLSTIAVKEAMDRNVYVKQPETGGTRMSAQERWHTRVLGQLLRTQPRGLSGSFLGRLEGRHRAVGGNALRAAVLGANDGLCSNLSLVMGVAGAAINRHGILVTGFAGLIAGACSMALGEWVSVTSARELAEREIRIESSELEEDPKGEGEELQLIYESKGLSADEAKRVVDQILLDKTATLDALAREELGIDPTELGGSANEAALASFMLFALGAIVPILPFLATSGRVAVVASVALSGFALFAIGAAITIFTGVSVVRSGSRQLALGLGAAGVTFLIGRAIGATLT
jgi:VIT1/CCC1 family predicted Fe2+/Mn2+ transporter